jgi:hypothetical protein
VGHDVNIYFTMTVWKRATYREKARTSSRLAARYQWYLETGLHDLIVSAAHPVCEALVRTSDLGCGGGPNRRPGNWSKPLPTSHLLVSWSGWGRPKTTR